MDQSSRFWDKITERYSKRPVADEAAYQKKLRVTRDYFQPDMEVLELGCGTESTAITQAPYVKHIHAIDISSKMIEIAKGKAGAKNIANVTFEQSTIDELCVASHPRMLCWGSVSGTYWITRKRLSARFTKCSSRAVFSSPVRHVLETR